MAEPYSYAPIDSKSGQVRLFKVDFDVAQALGFDSTTPIAGSLKEYYLPLSTLSRAERIIKIAQLPSFTALSYVWGNPDRSHQVTIAGRALGITENLYHALRDLQTSCCGTLYAWIDAISINQDDLVERSEQVLLMREIYSTATEVNIWLGKSNDDGRRCMKFIADLAGGVGNVIDRQERMDEQTQRIYENLMTAILKPFGHVARAGIGFGQAFTQVFDIMQPVARDDRARLVLASDTNLSLHDDIIHEIAEWRPSARHLRKVHATDYEQIAGLIDKMLIEDCPWFSRMWVVQELGAADSPSVMYAGASESWESFLRAVYYLHYTCKIRIRNIRKLTALEKIRRGWSDRYRQPLWDLVRECRYRKATDPRDKIYALLGLMGDHREGTLLKPDYQKPVGEVYAHATLHFITQRHSLDLICGWQIAGRLDLPSWVPDYSLDQDLTPRSLVPLDKRESMFAASGHDHRSKYILDASSTMEWSTLLTSGILIDTIALVSAPSIEESTFGVVGKAWCSAMVSARQLLPELSDKIMVYLMIISSAIYNCTPSASIPTKSNGTDPHLQQQLEFHDLPLNWQQTYILDAYVQSLFYGCGYFGERQSSQSLMRLLLSMPKHALSSAEVQLAESPSLSEVLEASIKRRILAVTKMGHIGTTIIQAQPGDIVCVLYGCSVPVILRKSRDVEMYQFIGECYLHGFMDGEAIAKCIKGELKEKNFILH